MTYEQTIEYLYSHLPMFSRIGPAAYKKDLHNTLRICSFLGDPHKNFKTIHIAGTNGKGSTSHMLAAILQEAGYQTGLYTSPHLLDFRERIRINGEMIDREFVVQFVEKTKAISNEISPSFFELTVAMAFSYFDTRNVDIAVIETGLGGRLDSTNVVNPLLSIITNIGFDHVNILGNTLPEIAREKAGIIKKNTPVIIGEILPETIPVFMNKAQEMNADLYIATDRYLSEIVESSPSNLLCEVFNKISGVSESFELDLCGIYQSKNLCTVLNAVDILKEKGLVIKKSDLQNGLKQVKRLTGLRGRWETVQSNPAVILDVAHNEDGFKQILQQLSINYPRSNYHFVLGFVKDKDVNNLLALLPKNAQYYFTHAHIPRALPFRQLQDLAFQQSLTGHGYDDINDAVSAARSIAASNDVIIVCGSFFIIGEMNL